MLRPIDLAAAVSPFSLTTPDGTPLLATRFEPGREAVASVVIHGATAVPQRHYASFARYLAARGYRVITYDYRGVGGSAPDDLRRCGATMSEWITEDAPTAVRAAVGIDPSLPLYAIGHSFGGQIAAGLAGASAPDAVVTAGAQRGYWATFPDGQKWLVALRLFALLPAVARVFGYVPGRLGLGEDMPSGVLLEWARWCRDPSYLYGDHPALKERIARYAGPVLALSVTDDDFAPRANVEWLLDRYAEARVEHLRFEPAEMGAKAFGHFGFFRSKIGGVLWPSIVAFLDERRGTNRPGAARRGAKRPCPPSDEARSKLLATQILQDLHVLRS